MYVISLFSTIFLVNTVKCDPISQFVKPDNLPKYFAIDIDNTFFVPDDDKLKKNIESLKLLKSKGVTFFFCTGRTIPSAKNLFKNDFETKTGYNFRPGVYMDGALIYKSDGKLLKSFKFELQLLEKFKEYLDQNGLVKRTVFHTESESYAIDELDGDVKGYIQTNRMPLPTVITFDDLKSKDVVGISFNKEEFELQGYTKGTDYNAYNPHPLIVRLTPKGCNKLESLKALLDDLKAKPEECAYIGDGDNDRECMKYCKISFAVGNASDDVKECAKWVVDLKHDEGAFAKVVNVMYGDSQTSESTSVEAA